MSEPATGPAFQPLGPDDPATVAGYRLAARLGAGGMGKVYLSHTPGGRPVAIKVIRPEFAEDSEFRRRFRQEVHAAQRVQGLYTAPVIDSDTDGPTPWLATAYVPGPTLAAAVAESGALPPRTVLMLVAGITEALQVIHGAGIEHRDLKPSNVLLASDGPRVIDFGIARAADTTSLTASGVSVGTPSFMSPEQAADREVGTATDVFALGLIAAFAALGTSLYGDGPSHAVLYRIVHEEPELTGLSEELRPLVTRCLAKDPAQRPSLTEILELCRGAADQTQLRRPEDWLPQRVAAGLARRPSVPAPVAGHAAAGTHPVTAPDYRIAPPAYQPTAPARPVSGAGPATAPPAYQPAPGPVPVAPGGPYGGAPAGPYGAPFGAYPAQPPQPQPPSASSGRRAGIVVASVFGGLLLLAGCGALVNLLGDGGRSGAAPGSGGSAAATGTAQSGGAQPSGGAQQPRTDPKPAQYQGFQLPTGYHLEFGDDPLQPRDSNFDDLYFSCSSVNDCTLGAYGSKLVVLDGSEKGSLATCRSATRFTTRVPVASLSKGTELCVRTKAGNIALVTYGGASAPSDPSTYITVDVTVWRGAVRGD
ncbi:serine/threonine-protein kinase [Streptomyces sp. NPDC051578]|uniref:serine/threonine-protein kinase n=1 Tax=Streptomyces sp. NPDC051578 TaxID=3365662 RepID=UPI00379B8C61